MTDKSTPTKKDSLTLSKNENPEQTMVTTPPQDPHLPSQSYINQNENFPRNQNFTFKIVKRRAPWNKKEDEAIIELVNKYGTSNWTIIANEMALLYKSKHRNGKQCRERWHNHLDPIVNKDNWTEEEENILFNKQLEYGNKWSDIAKYLPGRTDNSIKNHFYSKLRKFIRKILKQINKENLLKNNGIDYCKYNSDKVYKLLKKYKVSYKNVTKETVLDLIISIEKNQNNKIFGLNIDNKLINERNNLLNKNGINNITNNIIYNTLDNSTSKNLSENLSQNSSSSNKIKKNIFFKKSRTKKNKNQDGIDSNNINNNLPNNNKILFQSNIVPNLNLNINQNINNHINNINIISNQMNLINNIGNIPYSIKAKNIETINDNNNNELNDENDMNEINKIEPKKIKEKGKIKKNIATKIKKKSKDLSLDKKDLIGNKRKRKKKRKVTISLSTPEKKKEQINRIMPGRKYIYGLGHQRIQIQGKNNNTSSKKNKLNPEDFNPMINEVEIVREGLEIHSKSNILIDKNLLTENLFPDRNFVYKPKNLNISIPTSPKIAQIPTKNFEQVFTDKNLMISQPTPMENFFEPINSPLGMRGYPMLPPSTRNIYNIDLGYENNFLRKNNIPIPYTPNGYMSGLNTPNTPKREINMTNKIVIQNNNSLYANENGDNINKSKKPEALNMDLIQNSTNDIGGAYPPFFGVGDNFGPLGTKQSINSPAEIFKLSPKSAFIPGLIK